jgi:hypothetical protein
LLQRDAWSAGHAQRLHDAARQGGRVSPVAILAKGRQGAQLEEARRDVSRLGRVTHAVLDEWEPDLPQDAVQRLIRDICDRCDARDLVDEVDTLLRRAQGDATLGVWWNLGRVVGRGVPMQVRVGSRLLETRQDVVIETPEGIACIDYTVRARSRADAQTESHAQALHGAVLLQSGRKLARVGTLYLVDGVWQELDQAEERSRSFLGRLAEDPSVG